MCCVIEWSEIYTHYVSVRWILRSRGKSYTGIGSTYLWLETVLLAITARPEDPSPLYTGFLVLEPRNPNGPVYTVSAFCPTRIEERNGHTGRRGSDVLCLRVGLLPVLDIHPMLPIGRDQPFDLSLPRPGTLGRELLNGRLGSWREGRRGVDKDSLFGRLGKADSGGSATDGDGPESVLLEVRTSHRGI